MRLELWFVTSSSCVCVCAVVVVWRARVALCLVLTSCVRGAQGWGACVPGARGAMGMGCRKREQPSPLLILTGSITTAHACSTGTPHSTRETRDGRAEHTPHTHPTHQPPHMDFALLF